MQPINVCLQQDDLLCGGSHDETAAVVRFLIGRNDEKTQSPGLIPLRRANNDFTVPEDHLNLSPKDWLAGVELISFIMGRVAGQIVYKKDRLEITEKDFLRAGAWGTSIRKEVEAVLGWEKIGGSSLGNAAVKIAYDDGIHGRIFQLTLPIVKAPQAWIITSMKIYLVTPFAEKDAAKALGARWDAAKTIRSDVADLWNTR